MFLKVVVLLLVDLHRLPRHKVDRGTTLKDLIILAVVAEYLADIFDEADEVSVDVGGPVGGHADAIPHTELELVEISRIVRNG